MTTSASGSLASATTSPGAESQPPLPDTLRRGESVGRYLVLERIGAGGFGEVFSTYDPELDRKVALKLLRPRAGSTSDESLLREARTLAQLSHPHVVPVYDVGSWRGRTFLAMEFVDGVALDRHCDAIRTGGWIGIVAACVAAGEGLAAAHDAGILHRDFKPANVLVGPDGRPRLTDFGLARREDKATLAGTPAGTPAYMAPEQHRNQSPTVASEVYSFCVALWECLFGCRPFCGDSFAAMERAKADAPTLARSGALRIPRSLQRILVRGLDPDPGARWPSMRVLLDRLAALQRRPRHRASIVLTCGAALACAITFFATRGVEAPCATAPSTWTLDRERQLAAALTTIGVQDDDTAPLVRTLAVYSGRWSDAWRSACEATHVARVQSERTLELRMQCLERSRNEMDTLVQWLLDGDLAIARHASEAVAGLRGVEMCADVERLHSAMPLPEDPAQRREAEAIQTEIGEVRVLSAIGRLEDAQARSDALSERAAALAYAPVSAEALLAAGILQRTRGQHARARESLRRAVELAESSGHAWLKAQAFLERAWTEGYLGDDARRGEELVDYALAVLDGLDGAEQWQVRAFDIAGSLAYRRGDFAAAESSHRRALELAEATFGPDSYEVCDPTNNLALALDALDRHEEALQSAERARECLELHLGPTAPTTVQSIINLGLVATHQGNLVSARERFEEARERMGPSFDADHAVRGLLDLNLGAVLDELGDVEGAETLYRDAMQSLSRALGADAREVGIAAFNLACNLRDRGRTDEAAHQFHAAIRIFELRLAPDAAELVDARAELAALADPLTP